MTASTRLRGGRRSPAGSPAGPAEGTERPARPSPHHLEHERSGRRGGERGSGSALAASMLVLLAVTAFWVALFSAWIGSSHAARSSADLTAIAAAHAHLREAGACREAHRVAAANGAELVSCELRTGGADFVVDVTVSVPLALRVPGAPESLRASATAGAVTDSTVAAGVMTGGG